ncbi:MAG: hypothetical protein KatS3mg008_0579 [Acidimicrobiales bacterium]|nr:MAG: hypothetical protein KatS3mg008_0579 [Acidimicrobiales bacterium]
MTFAGIDTACFAASHTACNSRGVGPHLRLGGTRRLIGVALAVVCLAAACSRDEGAAVGRKTTPTDTDAPGSAEHQPGRWPGSPAPCDLLPSEDVEAVTGFAVALVEVSSRAFDGRTLAACLAHKPESGVEAGQLTLTLNPPGWRFGPERELFASLEELDGVGRRAWIGRTADRTAPGPNFVTVDMGRGGFTIAALVATGVDEEDLTRLARAAAARWE